MRLGEIIRDWEGNMGMFVMEQSNADGLNCAVVKSRGWEQWLDLDECSIVTVAELFEAAGHPVPEGARLFAHFLVGDGMTASDVRRYWGWRLITEVGHFLNGAWQVDKIDEANASDPIRIISAVSIDLSRLPALDAWDALPEIVKAVVK